MADQEALAGRAKVRAEQAARFLAALREGLTVKEACEAGRISRRTAYNRRTADPAFRAAWDEAWEVGNDSIEGEVYRRAVSGWDEPVFQKGEQVGTIRKYSDRMLELLAKRRIPEYREHHRVELDVSGLGQRMAQRLSEMRAQRLAGATVAVLPAPAPIEGEAQ